MVREVSSHTFLADYVGEPGRRSFFLQARSDEGLFTVAVEKGQVSSLAEKLGEVLLLIDRDDPIASQQPQRDPTMLPTPTTPEWRVGTMAIAYDEALDLIAILMEPVDGGEDDPTGGEALRLMVRREDARAFALHALAVVAEGRPLCQLCGLPMDLDGHRCPSSNGHHVEM